MKETVRNIKSKDGKAELNENSRNNKKILKINRLKKNYFVHVKWLTLLKKWEENSVEVIVLNGIKWLNEKNIEEQLGRANLPALTRRYPSKYSTHKRELVGEPKKQPNRMFLYEGLTMKIMMDCRTVESCDFTRRLGFNFHDVINTKEQTVLQAIKDAS